MKKLVVAIYDEKTKSWSDVISCPNVPTCVRMIDQMVRNPNSVYHNYPQDFSVYVLAETIEDDNGNLKLEVRQPYEYVCSMRDFSHAPKDVASSKEA